MTSGVGSRRSPDGAGVRSAVLALSVVAGLVGSAGPVSGQQAERVVVDSVAVDGAVRVDRATVLSYLGFAAGDTIGFAAMQRAEKALFTTGQYSDLRVDAEGGGGGPIPRVLLRITVEERPLVRRVDVLGLEHANPDLVRDSARVRAGAPYSPQAVIRAKDILRGKLSEEGIPFASIDERQIAVEGLENVIDLVFEVDEGQRVTVAQVALAGNEKLSTGDVIGAMGIRPEGFWWFRGGSFDETRYQQDLTGSIPDLYHSRGFLEAEVLSDTLIIDPSNGKARVEIQLHEGPQYRVGALSIEGNRHFEDEQLESFFLPEQGGLLRSLGLRGGASGENGQGRIFDQIAFNNGVTQIQQLYANEGYIFAQVAPAIERRPPAKDGDDPTVALTINIDEKQPAFINRVDIVGNDYTHERVIRDRIVVLPGDVYSQDRILRSYQSISALGFFEAPLPLPDMRVNQEDGTVDVTFAVKEKNTGAVNFGTSVGGGIGLAGFIGYDQPNLFGQAKEGHLRWDFGRYVNSFTLTYTDPSLRRSRVSGTISLFNSRDRFFSFNSGERKRVGTSLRFGFPVPGARWTRMFAGYSISRTRYRLRQGVDDTSLFGRPPGTQSQLSLGVTRTTLNNPVFPTTGSRMSWNVELNGGPLGGDGNFTRHLIEGSWWLPIGQAGGQAGGRPVVFALGGSIKGGAVFGNAENFPFDKFWMGGVQFGQALRGYDETSITPLGFFPENSRSISDIDRLGNAFLSVTAELAMRLNDNISLSTFFDAGNVWRDPLSVDPSQLFRGAGMGLQLVTPFGPIGLDYAYGFDKTVPGWQLHFRMGPGF